MKPFSVICLEKYIEQLNFLSMNQSLLKKIAQIDYFKDKATIKTITKNHTFNQL